VTLAIALLGAVTGTIGCFIAVVNAERHERVDRARSPCGTTPNTSTPASSAASKTAGATLDPHRVTSSDHGEQVYIMRGGDRVKIGRAVDPIGRLAVCQVGSPVPLELVWRIETPDGRRLEAALHRRYAEHRSHGEWFDAEPVLTDLRALAELGPTRHHSENSLAPELPD
jgi:Meiotically up-regulated gene 113